MLDFITELLSNFLYTESEQARGCIFRIPFSRDNDVFLFHEVKIITKSTLTAHQQDKKTGLSNMHFTQNPPVSPDNLDNSTTWRYNFLLKRLTAKWLRK